MKRSLKWVSDSTRSKRARLTEPISYKKKQRSMVYASKLYNYMMKDPIVDWIKMYGTGQTGQTQKTGTTSSSASTNEQKNGFLEFIMKRGVEFESSLVKYINTNKITVTTVSERMTDEGCAKTIELMKAGEPLIHSAPVKNQYNSTGGIIDLLIRSDYLDILVDECPLSDEEKVIKAPKLNGNYHYVVIDVKFSTLPLRSDGRHILNSKNYPAYKAQTLIYTQAIGHIQGYTSPYAFLMGRRWKYTSKNIEYRDYTCTSKLGVIDFSGVDKDYIKRTKDGIKWIRDLRASGSNWSVSPPSRLELYPNMCVESGFYGKKKDEIAKDIGELTSVWYVGNKHRNIALQNDITSWKDPNCVSKNIGITGERGSVIDKILDINRQNVDKIRPKKIQSNLFSWKDSSGTDVYIDFETISDIFGDFDNLPVQKAGGIIFMIGVWFPNSDKIMEYKSFICDTPTYNEEYRIMDEFMVFLRKIGMTKSWFWHAEKTIWKTAENRQYERACRARDDEKRNKISDWNTSNWFDLCKLFKSEPIVIKDCFKFGLKSIAKAMRKHGMISTEIDSTCDSGMVAMIKAWECYNENDEPASCATMKDIESYNTFDCKVLWEILEYLRKNNA